MKGGIERAAQVADHGVPNSFDAVPPRLGEISYCAPDCGPKYLERIDCVTKVLFDHLYSKKDGVIEHNVEILDDRLKDGENGLKDRVPQPEERCGQNLDSGDHETENCLYAAPPRSSCRNDAVERWLDVVVPQAGEEASDRLHGGRDSGERRLQPVPEPHRGADDPLERGREERADGRQPGADLLNDRLHAVESGNDRFMPEPESELADV